MRLILGILIQRLDVKSSLHIGSSVSITTPGDQALPIQQCSYLWQCDCLFLCIFVPEVVTRWGLLEENLDYYHLTPGMGWFLWFPWAGALVICPVVVCWDRSREDSLLKQVLFLHFVKHYLNWYVGATHCLGFLKHPIGHNRQRWASWPCVDIWPALSFPFAVKVAITTYYFFCSKSFKFISVDLQCNGIRDCSSGEDEIDCVMNTTFQREYPGRQMVTISTVLFNASPVEWTHPWCCSMFHLQCVFTDPTPFYRWRIQRLYSGRVCVLRIGNPNLP